MGLKTTYYKNILLETHQGNILGVPSKAKPVFLLALFEAIEEGIVLGNMFKLPFSELKKIYIRLFKEFDPEKKATPIIKPFYHLNSEPYYMIKWKSGTIIPKQAHTPSLMFLKSQVEFATLDDELWDLLQDPAIRNDYREAIINKFLKKIISLQSK